MFSHLNYFYRETKKEELPMNSETFRKNIKQILIPETDLQAKIKEVGAQISKEYDGKPLLLVSIL